jgi:hypothetical protein
VSDETGAELENAIAAHVADLTDGNLMTGWVITMSSMDPARPELTRYTHECPPTQSYHATVGLQQMGLWNSREHFMHPADDE